jgi:hypothetical protein
MPFMRKIITATLLGIVVVVATANFTLKKVGPSNLDIVVVKAPPIEITRAEQAIAKDFLDPASAQFRNVRLVDKVKGDDVVCGEVNAKNSYGAYVGFRKFYYSATAKYTEQGANDGIGRELIGYRCYEFTLDAKGEPILNVDYRR